MTCNHVITEAELQSTLWLWANRSSEVCAAVSYCGRDAAEFFPERSRPSRMRFMVDMSGQTVRRGLTNPSGVSKLCQLGDVRTLQGLHSKVIVFDRKAAIVGSANFSRNSVENQRQCCILTMDRNVVRQLRNWFEPLWREGKRVTQKDCKKSQRLFPKNGEGPWRQGRTARARFRKWRSPLEDYPLDPGDFDIRLTKSALKRAIHLFRTKQCGYVDEHEEKVTCAEAARRVEKDWRRYSRQFHSRLRDIDRWKHEEKEEIFNLAYVNRGAGMIGKPRFLRHPIGNIKSTMRYLFLDQDGNPLIRFEHAVKGKYKLPGMGFSGMAFLMHLWKPNEFAIWNGSVDKGLKKLKVKVPRPFSAHLAQGYQDRIAALREIMRQTGLKSFRSVDHFVDAFAKGHLKL